MDLEAAGAKVRFEGVVRCGALVAVGSSGTHGQDVSWTESPIRIHSRVFDAKSR
jgi:hypothetical protein